MVDAAGLAFALPLTPYYRMLRDYNMFIMDKQDRSGFVCRAAASSNKEN
jgi:hypothetical protein